MKVYRFLVLFFVLLVFLFSSLGISNAEAQGYCWDVVFGGEPKGVLKLMVVPIGDGYYFVQGRPLTMNQYGPFFTGSAQVVGTQIIMTLNATHSDSPGPMRDGGFYQVILDPTTLNGTAWAVGITYLLPPYDKFSNDYSEGTLTYTTCP